MFEHYRAPLIPRHAFVRRLTNAIAMSGAIIACALGAGMLGYHGLENLPWIDAFLNASMILTGMGPATPLHTDGGKIFASVYALFSGIVFLSSVAVILAPVVHRFLHKFHLE